MSSSSSSAQPQIPPEVLAQRQANITRINKLQKRLRRAVKLAPIILCSTHGIYDRSVEPVIWKVPKKTFIFEAQTIGDLTTTTIDVPLWELLQGGLRWGFMKYMTGDFSEFPQIGAEVQEHYKSVFSSLILYKPGDLICERVLSIGGGRDTKTSSARATYGGMGFFRFDAKGPQYPYRGYGRRDASGEPNPYEILPQLHDLMVTNGDREMTDHSFVEAVNGIDKTPRFRDGEPISTSFAGALPKTGPDDYKIFIFSSCAAISEDSSPEGKKRWEQIARIQEQRKLEQMEMGLELMGGQHGSFSPTLVSGSSKNLRLKGAPPSGFFVPPPIPGAIDFFSKEDPELKPEELFEEETEGGSLTRKVRKKFKRTRKLRRTLKRKFR
jgi:hypothetical protein